MVSNMVKKGAPAPIVIPPPEPKVTPTLPSAEEAVGEATEGDAMLDGMELDEDSVKAQQMLSQVSEMVGENPEAAANLVKRWLNRS
jgi:flagellar biosynthesis/type III secretory pathway M-ring protein FliF/YscJ